MIGPEEIKTLKVITENVLQKMTIGEFVIEINLSMGDAKIQLPVKEVVELHIVLPEPQILIGQNGETLLDLQHILKIVFNKTLKIPLYLNLDINEYKKKKVEYLKLLARETADQVVLNKTEKKLPPMSSYQRHIIHKELADRQDVITKSQGEGDERYIIVSPQS